MTNQAVGLNNYATGENSRFPELWRGCVGAWAMCLGPTGTRLFDFSGRQNWGTLTNMDAATDWVVSGGQYALDFDGDNDYVAFTPLTPALGFSFACWFKAVNASRTRQSLFSNATDASPDIYLHIESTSGTTNAMNFYNGGGYLGTSTTFTQDTNWHHYAWTTDVTGKVRYYRDGVFLSSPGLLWTPVNDNSSTATIGAIIDLIGPQFTAQGQIDDCRRYSRTITEAEIKLLASKRGIAYERRSRRRVNEQAAANARRLRILTGQT